MPRKPRKPKELDLTVRSMSDLLLSDPENMTPEKAAREMGLSFSEMTRDQKNALVLKTVESWHLTDDARRALVQASRNMGLISALESGNMKEVREWGDAIAAEPGVGLTQKQGSEQTLDLGPLLGAIGEALNGPAPFTSLSLTLTAAKDSEKEHPDAPTYDIEPSPEILEGDPACGEQDSAPDR